MRRIMQIGGALGLAATLGACAVDGAWMGADDESAYEQARDAGRLAAPRDNRFYAEIHRDGRIHVFADADAYARFRWSGRVAHAVTAIGADGQAVQFALNPVEAREQEQRVGYRGAAQQMFEGRLAGHGDGFYGEVHRDGRIYVFASWSELQQFRRDGHVADAERLVDFGPEQQTVIVAGPPDIALARFRALHRMP